MTALSTYVDPLKRELAVPGTFDDTFPDTLDTDLIGSLADGFAEAQLWGFFTTLTLTSDNDPVAGDWVTSEDLSGSGGALVILFAAGRILRAQIRALNVTERYKAGPAEVEFGKSASALRAELDYINNRIKDLIAEAKLAARGTLSATVHDGYYARGGWITGGYGFFPYEYRG